MIFCFNENIRFAYFVYSVGLHLTGVTCAHLFCEKFSIDAGGVLAAAADVVALSNAQVEIEMKIIPK